jgi:tetratricopeptide (TPR) repeat protein
MEELADVRRLYGLDDPRTLQSTNFMAWFLYERGRLAEAEPLAVEAVAGYRRILQTPDSGMLVAIDTLASIIRDAGRPAEALELFEEIARSDPQRSKLCVDVGCRVWVRHAECLAMLGRFAEAERELLANRDTQRAAATPDAALLDRVSRALAALYDAWHAAEPGRGYDARAAELRAQLTPSETPVR